MMCIDVGGADVLYNKFNVQSSRTPLSPPLNTNSLFSCVVDTGDGGNYWRLSQCTVQRRVVCQLGQWLLNSTHKLLQ